MKGIEAATSGVLGQDIELKTSRNGTAYANLSLAVNQGNDAETGRPVTQWVRCAVFGEAAEQLAAKARKGDRVYVEGSLTLTSWTDKTTGAERHGLNLACFKAEKIGAGAIGRNRQKGHAVAGDRQPSQAEHQLRASDPHKREHFAPFDDAMPW